MKHLKLFVLVFALMLTISPAKAALLLTGNGHTMTATGGFDWNTTSVDLSNLYFDYGDNGSFETSGNTDASLQPNVSIVDGFALQVRGNYVSANPAQLTLVLTRTDNSTFNLIIPFTPNNTTFTGIDFSDSNGSQWQVNGSLATGGDSVGPYAVGPDFSDPDTHWHLTFTDISAVPEPSTWFVGVFAGLATLGSFVRNRLKEKKTKEFRMEP